MKILMSGYHNPHFTNTTVYRENAVRALGHELISFDDRQYCFPGRLRQAMAGLERYELKKMNERLLRIANNQRPDVCIVLGGHRIFPGTVERLNALGIKTALWTSDVPIEFDNIIQAAPCYTHVFCAGTEAMNLLHQLEPTCLAWLPFGCDTGAHRPVKLTEEERHRYDHDVVFVGSYYPNRARVLESVADMDIHVWGPHWRKLSADSPLRPKASDAWLGYDEWVKIYNAAKIVVVAHFEDPSIPCHQISPKVFEAMACGSFVLTDAQKDLEGLFEDGRQLAVYRGPSELRAKLDHYLQYEDERQQIARCGYEEVSRNHTYEARMARIVSVLQEHRTKRMSS